MEKFRYTNQQLAQLEKHQSAGCVIALHMTTQLHCH